MSQPLAVITGAGSGLGRALAKSFAAAGYAICCADIRLDRAQETVSELGGAPHYALACDIGDDSSMTALAETVHARGKPLAVLINNAGVASGGTMADSDLAEWQWMLNLNVLGVVRGIKAFLPQMLEARSGRIINIASVAGLAGAPGIISYGTAKAAVVALSEQLRAEVIGRGIAVHVVCPGFFRTNLIDNFKGDARFAEVASKMMGKARESADDIARIVRQSAERGQFMIIPTRRERRVWQLKRWLPNWYFRQLIKHPMARIPGAPQ